jgi:hypothetical protein
MNAKIASDIGSAKIKQLYFTSVLITLFTARVDKPLP